ncbi:MAG: hypothetical protein A2275_04315 [Bacteroidetes bacterium RIFOXYA12_FULL_35_11]|nr:MAG: hypothetical protein A2X01_21770 [Bacteroidetes bacterium GWF2_35_48]OFY76645.1 MAG: hypothetical protein A2275_04315 [Bacteroidetes bacterium RIFOXYA12_FULL_35_11]OFY96317.1 MAG: hypothetical protein A2309_12390 [Bacteroidetes bacterium RIFOXYB2_FULL_35_7]HBX51474.1 hypothetical protein [Bacteroidales bacterium]
MFNFLKNPYPFNDDLKHNTKIIFLISMCVFAFLFVFQPLELSSLGTKEKFYLVIGICVITFISLSLNLLLLPTLIPKMFIHTEWKIGKEILWNIWILLTISVSYFFYFKYLKIMEFGAYMIVNLLLTAVIPISALIIINYNKMLRSNLSLANEINRKLKESKLNKDRIVYFKSDYQKDSLAIKVNLIYFIRSANNYIEIFWKENEIINNQMVRCSLTKAEELLKEEKNIFKCHRSYLVNINFIEKIEGNLQGNKLFFDKIDFSIPVSKNFANKLKELI